MRVEGRERLVQQGTWRARESARDPLALATRDLARAGVRQVGDAEPLEETVDRVPIRRAEADVGAHAEVGEERVVLEDKPYGPALRRQVDAARRVEPRVSVESDPPANRTHEPRDRPEDARLARARRPDQREGLGPHVERQLESERAEGMGKLCVEGRHDGISLTASKRRALAATSSAPIARAVSKSTSNCS